MVKPENFETREELLEESDLHGVIPIKYVEEYLLSVASSEDANYDAFLVDIVNNMHEDDLHQLIRLLEETTLPNLVSLVDDEETDKDNILLQIGFLEYVADSIREELDYPRMTD